MELNANNLTLNKEKTYFTIVLIISLIAWLLLAITILGLIWALIISVIIWLSNGLFVAYLRSESVLISEKQLPELFGTYKEVCQNLELSKIPELYVLQSGGLLNAFATRHAGRNFVVLYSDILESYGQTSDEIRFLLGHEIAHIKSWHILKRLFLFPGLILPLLGPAYSRACEASCDRYGIFVTKNNEGAIRAMVILSGGKNIGKDMSADAFAEQYKKHRGFFVSWHELISGYPTFSQRVANLIAIRDNKPIPKYSRSIFSYLFAFFSFGGQASSMGSFFIMIFIIAMLTAIAIPNLLRARMQAQESMAKVTLEMMAKEIKVYEHENGRYPASIKDLTKYDSTKLFQSHCGQSISGFNYECNFYAENYELKAMPKKMVAGSNVCIANKDSINCIEVKNQ